MFLKFLPLAALSLAAVVASWSDVFHRRVPNWLCAVTALAGLAAGLFLGGLSILGSQFLHMVIVLAAGMVLFRFGIFGGGDAKFYAAVAAWFTVGKAAFLLVCIAISGLALLVVWFAYRRIRRLPISRKGGETLYDSLPYGIAIGAGAVLAMLSLTGNPI
ncbi:prepilin peptidase [Novosphingobium sp. G106]|uniref:A24 family peptidase n=1 Tax=Novosphingobium sp. G106 TaxID=2849500 RepID=UPI001C2D2F73|nr:prepilin peptidase [Novosphingobium sp. G106]MBV1689321.1 prepilin peptidase [Novosphingobium sp. G106]